MHLEVPRVTHQELRRQVDSHSEQSQVIAQRVQTAHQRQLQRNQTSNHALNNQQIASCCQLSEKDHQLLEHAMEKLGLSARAYHRILKLARTIADLEDSDPIHTQHLTEALSFRKLDRLYMPANMARP
jgi:magnesium chelatase family protein